MEIRKGGKEYFNKKYIRDHPYYLFIYEDTLEDEDYEEFSNVFPIPTFDDDGEYFIDKYLDKNKDLIRDSILDIENALSKKRFKKIVIPEISIGKGNSNLYKEEKKTYEYIKKKVKTLLEYIEKQSFNKVGSSNNINKLFKKHFNKYNPSKSLFDNIYKQRTYKQHIYKPYTYKPYTYKPYTYKNSVSRYGKSKSRYGKSKSRYGKSKSRYGKSKSRYGKSKSRYSRKYRRKMTKKELKEKKEKIKKEKKKIKIDSLSSASTMGYKKCNKCIKLKSLIDKPIETNPKKANKLIDELSKAENKCVQCQKICKYIDKNLKKKNENYNIYEARYPSICLKDEYGNKRVKRLSKSYRTKLLEQIENLDLNLTN